MVVDMSLSEIYAWYYDSRQEKKERDQLRLYVTDLGKCKRQVAYRLLGTPKNPKADQTVVNESIMFDLADFLELQLCDALDAKGLLLDYQRGINIYDHENWGGRLDILADYHGARVIEVKSVRSNKFNYADELPDRAHSKQAAVYDHYIREEDGEDSLQAAPLLWYVDRGGSNTPLEFPIEYDWEEIDAEMCALDKIREALDIFDDESLPPQMQKVLKLRSYGKKIVLEPPWNCGYCDYSDACQPDMRKSEWANFDKGSGLWTPTSRADIAKLVLFAEENTTGKVNLTW